VVTNFFNRRLGFGGSVQVLTPSDLAGGILDELEHAGRSPAAATRLSPTATFRQTCPTCLIGR
jgi:hypothetical protein